MHSHFALQRWVSALQKTVREVISVQMLLLPRPVARGLFVMLCLASYVPVYTRNPGQILLLLSTVQIQSPVATYQHSEHKDSVHHTLSLVDYIDHKPY